MGKQRTGDEHIEIRRDADEPHLTRDYWAWNSSTFSPTPRGGGPSSEFIVSAALGLDLSGTRR